MNRLQLAAARAFVCVVALLGLACAPTVWAQSVPPYVNIITSTDCIGNLRGQPLDSGTLSVTAVGGDGNPLAFSIPGSMVGLSGMPQVFLANGELVGTLSLPNPAVTSPQGIGYTFTFSGDGHTTTFSKVAIAPDQNGNFDLCKLNVGQYSTAHPVSYPGGVWSPSAAYVSGSVVKFSDGNTYLAIAPSTGQSPAYNTAYWSLISAAGGSGGGGTAGAAATISVGATYTGNPGSNASVANVGNSNAAILNFTIPAGVQGATGPAGPAGPSGPTGVATAASIASLIQSQSGCTTAGNVWVPQSNTCVVPAAGGGSAPTVSSIAALGTLSNNTSGNAATAVALASIPTLCTGGQVPVGITANGNAAGCITVSTKPLTGPSLSLSGTTNGELSLTYTGVSATTPGTNATQLTQSTPVTVPYCYSMPGTPPPDTTHSVLSYALAGGCYVGSWISVSSGTTTTPSAAVSGIWQLNEGSGSTSSNHGTTSVAAVIANPTWVTQAGLSGGAVAFNGANGANTSHLPNSSTTEITIADTTDFNFTATQPFSVWAWINLASSQTYRIFGTEVAAPGQTSGTSGWEFGLQGNSTFFFELAGAGGYAGGDALTVIGTATTLTPGSLHLLVITYDGTGVVKGYIDGLLDTSNVALNSLHTSIAAGNPIQLGFMNNNGGTTPFTGNMGPVGVIGRVLTQSDVNTIYGSPYAIVQ
jgi:hypothetical protein